MSRSKPPRNQMCSRQSTYLIRQSVSNLTDKTCHFDPWPSMQRKGNSVNAHDVKKPILILVLLVDRAHQRGSRRQDLIDEDEDGLLGRELDALADDVDELAHGQVRGDQVLLLVDGRDVGFLGLFADDL